MRRLTSIVALNKAGVIGCGNSLPWRVRDDMRFFKETTTGNSVIMGRKTHDSLGKCLPNRYNVVISHQLALFESTPDCVLRHSIAEAIYEAERAPARFKECFVIGGSTMYQQFSGLVDRYLITVIDKNVPLGDAFFDESLVSDRSMWDWRLLADGEADQNGNEAAYQIFEVLARDHAERTEKRALIMESFLRRVRSKATAVRPKARTAPEPQLVLVG